MWSQLRGPAAAAVLGAVLLTAGCHATVQDAAAATPSTTASPSTASSGFETGGGFSPTASSSPAPAGGSAGPVVALGDSYTAGALLPLNPLAKPADCLRSTKAYPVLVADALGAQLTDVACASAGVKTMTAPQKTYLGTNPAQLTALKPDDKLVLLTLGGDDLGFLNVLQECMKLSAANHVGSPCEARYTAGGTNQLAASVTSEASKIAQVLTDIGERAPRARVVVVGYPDLFPQSGGCWPTVPIAPGDIAYLRGIEVSANAMLAADARAAGDTYVDTYTPTIGHDFCQPESTRDVEGLVPGSLALPFHPNARGQQAIATAVLKALQPS